MIVTVIITVITRVKLPVVKVVVVRIGVILVTVEATGLMHPDLGFRA